MDTDSAIKDASSATPDPDRAIKNLYRLQNAAPEFFEEHLDHIQKIALLFAYSQFLSDYCIRSPEVLHYALADVHKTMTIKEILPGAEIKDMSKPEMMRLLRNIRKNFMLRITLRDIMSLTGISESMTELSILADALIQLSLNCSKALIAEKFGDISDDAFAVIALGKLGAYELNYSSDVDIISVYKTEDVVSSGLLLPSGVRVNKINSHEYFSKVTELLSSLLSFQTEDGFAYRVDLRLRPNGQKGGITMSLASYLSYYESYGKTWERMALIRARPVAGEQHLGNLFIESIEPFVWKRSTDYNDIEEVKELKKKIDTISDVNDIKRGYGGIRETEFFVQTFQLLYGGERQNLRTARFEDAVRELMKEGFLISNDVNVLSGNYFFMRRLEHILQMKDDRQTYSVPVSSEELEILSRKMNFSGQREFVSELKLRRLKMRDMYNSLFGVADIQQEIKVLFDEELGDDAIRDYLSFKGFRNLDSSLKNFKTLSDEMSFRKTIRERSLLRKVIPIFLDLISKSENKDRALTALVSFVEKMGGHDSYIDLLSKRMDTIEALVNTFSLSKYLTRALLSLDNLEGIFEYPDIRMDYKSVRERLIHMLSNIPEPMNAIRECKMIEELKTGLLFIKKIIDIEGLSSNLTMLADTIFRAILDHPKAVEGFAVIGLGGFGAKELSFGSDLDLLFVAEKEEARRTGEEIIRFLSGYTKKGVAYRIDMGLRPDGSKGILANDIRGYRDYYLKHAHPWEVQALLRARPIAGDGELLRSFYFLKKQVIIQRGHEITGQDIINMRNKIIKKISREVSGYDIKHGPGGIEDMGFLVQYLQLKHAAEFPNLIIHNTFVAVKRLARSGIIDADAGQFILRSLGFMRTLETMLRLNDEDVLESGSGTMDVVIKFLDMKSKEMLVDRIENIRQGMMELSSRIYGL